MKQVLFESTPVTPSKIICVGRNYVEHIRELDNTVPDKPVIFLKPNSAISDEIRSSREARLHYEAELSFLIRDGTAHGVGFGLDLTRRELQAELKRKGLPWERAKAFDGSAVFSHFVRLDCALVELSLQLDINATTVQQGGYAHMIWKPETLIEEIRTFLTLEDGDVVMTGTPAGVGEFDSGDIFTGHVRTGERVLVKQRWTAI